MPQVTELTNQVVGPQENRATLTMMQMVMGSWVSQAIRVAAKLGVADAIANGPRAIDDLAQEIGVDRARLYRLVRACTSVGVFVEVAPGTFTNNPLSECLRASAPGSMRDLAIAMNAPGHWLPWGHLEEAVRAGGPVTTATLGTDLFSYYERNPEEGAYFHAAMGNLSDFVSSEVVRNYDFSRCELVVDLGGAHGALISAVLLANPFVRGILFDLPHVVEGAATTLQERRVLDRCERIGGDFFEGVPSGGDVYLLKIIIHDWDDARAIKILRMCRDAMKPSGHVVLIEMVIPEDNSPSPAQLIDLDMMVLTTGRERTEREYAALMRAAGLELERMLRTETPYSVLVARRTE